jgi:cyanophycin synthetase
MGADLTDLAYGFWRVRLGIESTLINNHVVQIDDPVILRIAGNKALCHDLLTERGLAVPEHQVYRLDAPQKALDFISKHPRQWFVVKPSVGTAGGQGITLFVKFSWDFWRASVHASSFGDELLLECFVPGECYRLLFLDGEMIHAVRQKGLWVSSDGQSTLEELFRRACTDTARRRMSLARDKDFHATVEAQGLSPESVLRVGQNVLARSMQNRDTTRDIARTLYDEDATQFICDELRREAQAAVQALGSRFASVELVTMNPQLPMRLSGGAIIEINTTPGLHRHVLSDTDAQTPLAIQVLGFLLQSRGEKSLKPARASQALNKRSEHYENGK